MSAPSLPSIVSAPPAANAKSSPEPRLSVSAPDPPSTLSSPAAPLNVMGSGNVPVATPNTSPPPRSVSSPPRPSKRTLATLRLQRIVSVFGPLRQPGPTSNRKISMHVKPQTRDLPTTYSRSPLDFVTTPTFTKSSNVTLLSLMNSP